MAEFGAMTETMKRVAAALRDAEVPYLLGGGLALWAYGAPESSHDVDFLVKPDDVERAVKALAGEGLRIEQPPEDWLVKAFDGEVMVDLIFEPTSGPISDEIIDRGEEREILAMRIRVASLEDVMVQKLLAITEQEPDYAGVLEPARSLRERIDWAEVRTRTEESPFAQAFFTLVQGLGIVAA